MGIHTLYDTGSDYSVTSKMDGAVYNAALGGDYVLKGIGDEFELNYSSSSLRVSFNPGSEAVIGGGFFKVATTTEIDLPTNRVVYLTARITPGSPAGSTGTFEKCDANSMITENINGSGSARDMLLYIITTNSSGVINVVDQRKIVNKTGIDVLSGPYAPSDAVGKNGDIYIQYES